jgi:uncharacterized membrane protein YbhN (UPF0104 family)
LCGVFLYKRLLGFDFLGYKDLFKNSLQTNWWMLGLAFILIFLNWGIETVKWKFLIQKIEQLSFFKTFSAVIGGVAVSSFTPNRVGEFAGRMLFLKNKLDTRVVALTVIGSMSQLLMTFFMGLYGFFLFLANDPFVGMMLRKWMKISFIAIPVIYLLIFWSLPFILGKLKVWFKNNKHMNYFIEGTSILNISGLRYIFFLSFFRYVVFLSQYILVLSFFNVSMLWWQFVVFIPAIFFVQTIVPTFAISEIGVRMTAAMAVLSFTQVPEIRIVAASTLIWAINIMIPSIIGVFTLLFSNLSNKE